ncbi:trifunctional dihydropteroate synthetase [Recurvomyces mirabilis]|nr:trifunctional dihydropteroate synthetase [Recurvomyces mirabilis]
MKSNDAAHPGTIPELPIGHDIVQHLERLCQRSQSCGLRLWILAATSLASGYSDLELLEIKTEIPAPVLRASTSPMGIPEIYSQVPIAIVARNTETTTRPTVYVNIPYKGSFTLQIADYTLPINEHYTIRLEYIQDLMSTPHPGDSNGVQAPLESVRSLAIATRVVINQVLGGMTFASAQSAASFVSEALLRTLQDRLCGAKLVEVDVIRLHKGVSEPSLSTSTALAKIPEAGVTLPQVTSKTLGLVKGDQVFGKAQWPTQIDTSNPAELGTIPRESTAIVALGSNVGDRLKAIEDACRTIDDGRDMRIVRTSNLYESEPILQAIEVSLGRVKLIDKGPRNIDLDILLYDSDCIESERLTIPHQLLKEREFVLRPLDNLGLGSIEPLRASASSLLRRMGIWSTPSMYSQVALGPPQVTVNAGAPKRRTQVMSILNVTPDSFSDGGVHEPTDLEALKASVSAHIVAGATIIDIGGQSSRPNAPDVTADDEITRILPAIQAIKSLPAAEHIAISIDTYRASVAEAAIKAGAHIINDISGGLLDAEMLSTIARLGCTYIIMHMRGTPDTMQNEENLQYPAGLVPTISAELKARLQAAEEAGIRRWRIILDPGIGFSKTVDQNLEILRELPALRQRAELRDMSWLVGSSRKGFVGKVTDVAEAKDRTWGTAATVTAAVQGGAEIVRVHDVAEMAQVVKMSDAIYRV